MSTVPEVGLGVPIPDDPTDPPANLLEDASDAQIEAELAERLGERPERPADDDEPTPAAPPQPRTAEPPAQEPEQVPEPQPAEPEDPVETFRREQEIERQRMEARLELQLAHNSRLAGQLGELKRQLTQRVEQPQPGFQDDQGLGEISRVHSRLDAIDESIRSEARSRAFVEEVTRVDARPEAAELYGTPEGVEAVKEALKRYAEDWKDSMEESDPTTARKMTRAVAIATIAEARAIRSAQERETARARSAEQGARLRDLKKGQAPLPSAGTRGARPQAKSLDDLSDAEIERLTDEAISTSR